MGVEVREREGRGEKEVDEVVKEARKDVEEEEGVGGGRGEEEGAKVG